jgi:hypothetical protein
MIVLYCIWKPFLKMSCEILDNLRPVAREDSDDTFDKFQMHYRMKKPVIMPLAGDWGALENWKSLSHVVDVLNNPLVNVLVSNNNRSFLKHEYCTMDEMELVTALEAIFADLSPDGETNRKLYCRLYLDTHPELIHDIAPSTLCQIAGVDKFNDKNCGVWISSKGCETPLHYDLCHGFLAQVIGRKRFLLASPDDTQCMYRNTSHTTKNQTSSKADLSAWISGSPEERRKYPYLADAQWFVAELGPGDVLYTPPGWWHQVLSEDSSISVLLPFDMVPGERLASILCC